MKKKLFKLLLSTGVLLIGIGIFLFLKLTRPASFPVIIKERVWQVETQIAKPALLAPTLTLYGRVETPALVNAATPGKGRVLTVTVNEGDKISKGQLLLSLDPRDYQANVARARANVTELQALINSEQLRYEADKNAFRHEQTILNLEKSAVNRAKKLKNRNMGSTATLEQAQEKLEQQQLAFTNRKMNLDDHQSRLQQLLARQDYAKAELDLAELDLERSQIIAPFDGYVEKLLVSAGDQVKDNQILLTFYPLNRLEVRSKIPVTFQHELQRAINQGDILSATTTIAGIRVTLVLDRLAGAADTRGIDALFKITDGNEMIRLGSSLSLTLQRPVKANALAIPFSALYDNDRIYKLVNNRIEGLHVNRLGEYTDAEGQIKLLISSPKIKTGDRIVITQLPNAVSGLRVKETDSNPAIGQ